MKIVKFVFLTLSLTSCAVMSERQSEFTVPANSRFMFDGDLISPSVVEENGMSCLQYFESIQKAQIRGLESGRSSIAIYCPDTERSLADAIGLTQK